MFGVYNTQRSEVACEAVFACNSVPHHESVKLGFIPLSHPAWWENRSQYQFSFITVVNSELKSCLHIQNQQQDLMSFDDLLEFWGSSVSFSLITAFSLHFLVLFFLKTFDSWKMSKLRPNFREYRVCSLWVPNCCFTIKIKHIQENNETFQEKKKKTYGAEVWFNF